MPKYTFIVTDEQREMLEAALRAFNVTASRFDAVEHDLMVGMIAHAEPHEQDGDYPVINDLTA